MNNRDLINYYNAMQQATQQKMQNQMMQGLGNVLGGGLGCAQTFVTAFGSGSTSTTNKTNRSLK